jgi:hypothetical protein
MRGPPLFLKGNDDRPLMYVHQLDTANPPARIKATGLTGLTFRISASKDGAAIDATLQKNATELGTTGYYTCVLEGSDIITYLTAYAGQDVHQVFGNGADINVNLVRKVLASRP